MKTIDLEVCLTIMVNKVGFCYWTVRKGLEPTVCTKNTGRPSAAMTIPADPKLN